LKKETTRFSANYNSTAWYYHLRLSTKGTLESVLAIIMALPAPDEAVWWKLTKGIIF
jgi:hypothetical protein